MRTIVLVPNPNTQLVKGQILGDSYVPLGLLSIATILNHKKIPVRIVDINKDNLCLYLEKAVEAILNEKPDIIGFSTQVNEYFHTIQMAKLCKEKHPNSLILFGGPQASITDVATMNSFPFVDIVVRGECEGTIIDLIDAIGNTDKLHGIPGITFRDRGKIVRTREAPSIEILDDIPIPNYDLFPDVRKYENLPIEVGRGCPFGCTFCSTKDFFQRKIRFKKIDQILQLMAYLRKEYGVRSFSFQHDNITSSKTILKELCIGIKRLGLDISWGCSARLDSLDQEVITLMAESGCNEIFLGIETGSPRMQRIIDKQLDLNEVICISDLLRSNGINFTASFMMGFPEEELEDLEMTIRLMTALRFKGNGRERIQLHMVSVYPGTKIHEENKANLLFDGYYSDIAVPILTKDTKFLVKNYPEIFTCFQYIGNARLDRKFILKVNFLFLSLMYFFPYTCLAISQTMKTDFPRKLLEALINFPCPKKTWVLSNDGVRINTVYDFLFQFIDINFTETPIIKEVLTYEKNAVDLDYDLVKNEQIIITKFDHDIEGWLRTVKDGLAPPLTDFMNQNVKHIIFCKKNDKVKTMIVPAELQNLI